MGYTSKRVQEVAVPVHCMEMMVEGLKQLEGDDLQRRIDGIQLHREGIDAARAAKMP